MSTYIGWRGIEPDDVEAKDIIAEILRNGRSSDDDEYLRGLLRACPRYVIDDLLDMDVLITRTAEDLVFMMCSSPTEAREIIVEHREYRKRKEGHK